jgi:predicted peptidase
MSKPRGSIVALLVALALIAVACGGDDAATTTAAAATTQAPATTQASTTTTTSAAAVTTIAESPTTTAALVAFSIDSLDLGRQQAYSFVSSSGVAIEYLLYVPEAYDEDQAWPLILSLHGFLGADQSLESVRTWNPVAWVDPNVEFPFVVVAPKASGLWSDYHEPMDELFDVLGESLSIDRDAQFLTGLSAGAPGVWHWALAMPDRFAGIAPIAGSLQSVPEDICRLSNLPIWMAHGEADAEIRIEWFAALVEALEDCGSTAVRFTDFAGLGHIESIGTAWAGPDLYQWMLQKVP